LFNQDWDFHQYLDFRQKIVFDEISTVGYEYLIKPGIFWFDELSRISPIFSHTSPKVSQKSSLEILANDELHVHCIYFTNI